MLVLSVQFLKSMAQGFVCFYIYIYLISMIWMVAIIQTYILSLF